MLNGWERFFNVDNDAASSKAILEQPDVCTAGVGDPEIIV